VGRGPLVERNRDGLPIGEFLYEAGRERALQHQAQVEEERSRSLPSTPRLTDASRVLFEETKLRKYRDLFDSLVRRDPDQKLRSATLWAEGLPEEMVALLHPLFADLQEHGDVLDFQSFTAALDYHRRLSAVPTAHLFVHKCSARTSEQYRQRCEEERFSPQTDRRSRQMAARMRTRSMPVHEQLHRDRDFRDQRLQEQRLLQEERELRECTFQPNTRPSSAGSGRYCGGGVMMGVGNISPANSSRSDGRDGRVVGSLAAAALRPGSTVRRTPASSHRADGGQPGMLLGQLSLYSDGSDTGTPTGDLDEVDPALGSFCREQLDEVEKAVAHCKSVVAMARETVSAVSVA